MRSLTLLLVTAVLAGPALAAEKPAEKGGEKPVKELILPGESFLIEGRPAFVLLPPEKKRVKPQPWVLYAPTLPGYPDAHEKWMHERFLDAGVAVAGIDVGEAYGSPKGKDLFTAFYKEMTARRGFAPRPCLLGRSRGGLWVTSWAADNPDKVAGLAGIYPVFDLRTYPGLAKAAPAYGLTEKELEARLADHNPIERVGVLAKARVPALLIHGDEDKVVPLKENSAEFAARYKAQGADGVVKLIVAKGQGHNYWEGFFRCQELIDFTIAQAQAGKETSPPKGSGQGARGDIAARSVKGMKLKVSANGRYFVDQDGKPFFYLGDTCWLLFQRLNRDEVEEYLKDRAGKGFTVMQAYVIRGLDRRHPDGNGSLLGEVPFIDRDPTKPNEAFFKNVDYVVNRANELGLVMGLVTAKSWHVNAHPEKVFDEKNAYTFGKFLGERYKNNAVMWYPGGDSAPGSDEAVWVAMARGLKEGSGGAHLVSYHGSGQTSSSTWFHKATWLDFNSIQSGHGWAAKTYRFIDKDYGLKPAKPTVDMEPPYENHPTGSKTPRIDSHQVRKGAYWNMLAGAAGHGYGALDLFWLYRDGDVPFPKNGFQPWRKAMAYEGSRQVGFMRRLFELRPWYKLVPDQSVIAAGQGEGEDLVRAARAEDGSFLLAYLPTGKPVSIKMSQVSGKTVKAQWYDPREGTWKKIGEYPNTGDREFVAPSQGERSDWVLVLEDAAKGLPTAP
jgi:hypothetical protein